MTGELALEVDGEDSRHVRCQRGGELGGSQVEGVLIRLDEHRTETGLGDGEDGSDVGIGRGRDRVAVLDV